MYTGVDFRHVRRLDGGVQTENIRFRPLKLTTFQGDVLQFNYDINREGLEAPFEISPGVVLPVGVYDFKRFGIRFTTSEARRLSLGAAYWSGDFFNGTRDFYDTNFTWRPVKHFAVKAAYTQNNIKLEQGNFITRLMSLQADVVLSNTFSITNLVQFDNVSDNLGINIRAHWNPQAGRDVFFVVNYNMVDTDEGFVSTASDITLKFGYTFRF